jgi:electron transport complex protein RnfG
MTAPPGAPHKAQVPVSKLLVTLGAAGAVAGFLIVFVYAWSQPIIQAYKAEQLRLAVQEVLKEPDHFDTLYVYDGALLKELPQGVDGAGLEQIFLGYTESGERIGFAVAYGEPGFQDIVRVIFGYDRAEQTMLGMKVLESKETPGLGDKIEKDTAFVNQFDGALAPLLGVKPREATGEAHEIDMITGATISSRVVIRIINNQIERLGPMMDAYVEQAATARPPRTGESVEASAIPQRGAGGMP